MKNWHMGKMHIVVPVFLKYWYGHSRERKKKKKKPVDTDHEIHFLYCNQVRFKVSVHVHKHMNDILMYCYKLRLTKTLNYEVGYENELKETFWWYT